MGGNRPSAQLARRAGGIVIQPNAESPIPSKETIMSPVTLSRRQHTGKKRPARARPVLELLEDRTVLSTLTVLNTLDSGSGSLRDTIKAASSGDTIQFDSSLSGQTITLTSGELAITKSLDIEGPGGSLLAISGNNASRVFNVSQNQKTVAVTIAGLTVEDGQLSGIGGGGILNVSSILTLNNDVFSNNVAIGKSANGRPVLASGGAVYNENDATLTVSDCTFSGNQALSGDSGNIAIGGAILNYKGSTATVTGSIFRSNLAQGSSGSNAETWGGAITNIDATLTVSGCTFSGNEVLSTDAGIALGGAVFNNTGATATITDSSFTGNLAQGGSGGTTLNGTVPGLGGGGAIFNDGGATLSVSGSTFTGNQAVGGSNIAAGPSFIALGNGSGGGLSNVGVATVTNCTFTSNQAVGGNGNSAASGARLIGSGFGGGINTAVSPGYASSLTVSGCTFTKNQAVGGTGNTGAVLTGDGLGGGLTVRAGATATVNGCTFSDNSATGGVGADGQNGGDGLGGGLYNDRTSTLTVIQSTVTGNYAFGGAAGSGGIDGQGIGGGAYFADGGIVCLDFFTQTNIAGNHASTSDANIFGSYTNC
jgi:hypothetical protein